jgi:hypothetical protein
LLIALRCAVVSLGNKIPLSAAFISSIAFEFGLLVPIPTFCANDKEDIIHNAQKRINIFFMTVIFVLIE